MTIHLQPNEISLTRDAAVEFFFESQLPGKLDFEYWVKRWVNVYDLGIGTMMADTNDLGTIRGIMGAVCVPCMMTGELECHEAFWFVREQYRGSTAGIALLKAFERWGRDRGAKRAKMVHLESLTPEKLEKLYIKMGYSLLQRAYSKELS